MKNMTKVQQMTSHPSVKSGERRVMKIATGFVEFPTTELQEHEKVLSHIELVLSKLLMEVLHGLQTSVTCELQLRTMSTSMELTKEVADKDVL
jgi:hypothetical protein